MNSSEPLSASRREARRQLRRETILDVAERSFLEHGYAGTTMSAIAAALGGSKGTLWGHFASKEVLFAAVVDRATQAFRSQLSLILNPHDDLEVALRRFCAEFMRKITSPRSIALHRLVMSEANRFPEMGRIFYESAPRQVQQQVADFLAIAIELGKLRREDPWTAARQLNALCMAAGHQQMLLGAADAPSTAQIEAEVEHAMRTFMRAYGAETVNSQT